MSLSPKQISARMDQLSIDVTIDTCGTRCPLPLLRAKQALKGMEPGQLLLVLATDPAAKTDFDAMLCHLPHQLVAYDKYEKHEDYDEKDALTAKYPRIDTFVIEKGAI